MSAMSLATHELVTKDLGHLAALTSSAFLHKPRPGPLGIMGPVLAIDAGAEIYSEGDRATSFYRVEEGVVRTCQFSADGKRQIAAFYLPGEIFGLEAGAAHSLSAEAVSDCRIVAYKRSELDALIETDVDAAREMMVLAMRALERTQSHALALGRRGATERVAAFLLDMADRSGCETINMAMTREDIADYLGLTLETVSRAISQLKRSGFIVLATARCIRLRNRQALRHLNS